MRQPTVLTVILNYKTPDMTLQSLSAALREMDGIEGAITIVDNDSQDGSYETLVKAVHVLDLNPIVCKLFNPAIMVVLVQVIMLVCVRVYLMVMRLTMCIF